MSHDEQATHCDRCGRPGRANGEDPVPDTWVRTYNAMPDGPTGLLCPGCADEESIAEDKARNEEADQLIAQTMRDIRVDEELGRPAGGRPSDAMLGIPPPDDGD